ncbi:MAG: PhzF family phenazine biosynthesis protein [Herbiconiux sp.]|uniref:PhzF family phenazine biosynthesis protein n=1 Tax=Herbiconiux sp. TaxID=1871186 RepID=UPI001211C4E6|nr:PhzF family phenazine biosynthesis protein [Herbiconiux sp.]TAJ50179.1 MAG: PhzF family phenazine biosynthesis protein [Herbiconiux sp.]
MTTSARVRVPFVFVDVFADEPLTGNPLALVPDADNLPVERMRAIAREFNQSETTFLVRPTRPEADWRLRSFTPGGVEVLGAGHNAMGAWIWLAEAGRLPPGRRQFVQEIGDDLLGVEVAEPADAAGADAKSVVTLDHSAPRFGRTVDDLEVLAAVVGLAAADVATSAAAQVVSTGAGHLLVGVRDRGAVDRAVPDVPLLLAVLREAGGEGCYVYSRDPVHPESGSVAYARFFNPTVGIVEDPATGTAAAPLVALLVAAGEIADGRTVVVEQGHAIGRPSRLTVSIDRDRVRLSGSGLVSAEGVLLL